MSEEWRQIDEYPSYNVSDLGRVKNITNGLVLRLHDDGHGYWQVGLSRDGVKTSLKVHRLVCRAFHGPPHAGQQVAHLDGNRKNARADNLAWATQSENEGHKVAHGTSIGGARHPMARLDEATVREIRERASNESLSDLAREFSISVSHCFGIAKGKKWRSVPVSSASPHQSLSHGDMK